MNMGRLVYRSREPISSSVVTMGRTVKAPVGPPNGGYARAGADRALVTECHPALGPISRKSPTRFGS